MAQQSTAATDGEAGYAAASAAVACCCRAHQQPVREGLPGRVDEVTGGQVAVNVVPA